MLKDYPLFKECDFEYLRGKIQVLIPEKDMFKKEDQERLADLFRKLDAEILTVPAGSIFADVGSGTGIFTEQLLHCGYRAFAVEPNADMRKQAEEKLSACEGFQSVSGSDADMKLPDRSVDYITAAQAFHWFDAEAFRRECRRILRPGGKVILVYNSRDESAACTRALAALRQNFTPEFHGFSNGISDEACRAFFAGNCEVFRAGNTQVYDRKGYLNRVLSSSYSLKESDARYAEYLNEINGIFDRFSADGQITVPTETVAYIGEV